MVARMVPHGSRAFAKGTEVVLGGPNQKGNEIQLRTSYKTLPLALAYLVARIIVQEASCFSLSFAGPG